MEKKCEVDGCECAVYSNGGRWSARPFALSTKYCRKHLRWLEQYGTLEPPKMAKGSLEFRFWKHVDKRGDDECWEWKADTSRAGYGSIWDRETNRNLSAHRVSYELHNGLIENGKHILHSCDNKKCVNPNHLRQGTGKENVQDAIERGQKKPMQALFGEQNPKSKLTLEQVRFIRANPQLGNKKIADMWGLSPNCIRGVRIGRTWNGIE